MKVKRKKLRGCTTEKAHEMMDKLSFNKFKRNVSSLLTNEDLICYKCNKRLEDLPDLINKVKSEKANLTDFISKVVRRDRKRKAEERIEEDVEEHLSKSAHKAVVEVPVCDEIPASSSSKPETPNTRRNESGAPVSVSNCLTGHPLYYSYNKKEVGPRDYCTMWHYH
jgi:hypothetical protein